MKLMTIAFFAGNITFNAVANLMMKLGMKGAHKFDLATFSGMVKGFLTNWVLIGGCAAYVASLGFYLCAIKDVKLSIGYPLSVSLAIILVTVLSNVLLKESISAHQLVGGAVILVGIFIMAR
jgi:multidrug transporter EmrE-like cation transporter